MTIALYYFKSLFDTRNPLGLFMDVIQLAIPINTHIFIIYQAATLRKFHRKVWQLFMMVEKSLKACDIDTRSNLERFFMRYSVKCVTLIVIACGTELTIIGLIAEHSDGWKWHRTLALAPFLGNRLCLLMLMLYIELYHIFLTVIAEEMAKVVKLSQANNLQNPLKQFILYHKCKCFKENVSTLWYIMKYINKSFGWSIFVNITMNFIILIVDYYWNFKALYLNTSASELASLLCSIPLVAVLLPFIQSCDRSLRPIESIKHLMGKIKLDTDNQYLNRFIKQFSLQILQYKFDLSASGFFSINFGLLQGFVSSMTIYLVIVIQFELSDHYTY
ncbi:gustatory receptor 23a-like [Phlebotomus argentipes]|uniref:gustatory receptor 23a-like n=1 Tax=Phlebotomus argentipes TaxID=94469 RepID=UPI002893747A|nr:gustatory receptor 23a-like [Phlebotomus argentipes]